jgi:hypothetical protein
MNDNHHSEINMFNQSIISSGFEQLSQTETESFSILITVTILNTNRLK